MKNFIAIVKSSGEDVTKYLDFDTQSEADAHVKTHGGFSQKSVGDHIQYYKVADGKATYNDDKIASDNLAKSWASLRQERNIKLADTDWRATSDLTLSDEWKAYRKSLRDLPSTLNDTTILEPITWPEEPS